MARWNPRRPATLWRRVLRGVITESALGPHHAAGVEKLWMKGAYPVERVTRRFFFTEFPCESARRTRSQHIRTSFRLIEKSKSVEFHLLLLPPTKLFDTRAA